MSDQPDISNLDDRTKAFIQDLANENLQLKQELLQYQLGYKGPYMVKDGDRARYMSLKDVSPPSEVPTNGDAPNHSEAAKP